jgi:hypothetical protein
VSERATRAARRTEREVSRGHSRANGEGLNDGEGETTMNLDDATPQVADVGPSAQTAGAVSRKSRARGSVIGRRWKRVPGSQRPDGEGVRAP